MERSKVMKRLFLLLSAVFIFISCQKDHQCDIDQEYNTKTKECDCVQSFPESERPVLKTDDYNSWYAVRKHFTYSVRYKYLETYPFYSHEGDTLLLSGWMDHTPLDKRVYSIDSSWVQILLLDDSLSAAANINYDGDYESFIVCPVPMLKGLDMDKKIYIKGLLTFNFTDFVFDFCCSPGDPEHDCWLKGCAVQVLEIKNRKE